MRKIIPRRAPTTFYTGLGRKKQVKPLRFCVFSVTVAHIYVTLTYDGNLPLHCTVHFCLYTQLLVDLWPPHLAVITRVNNNFESTGCIKKLRNISLLYMHLFRILLIRIMKLKTWKKWDTLGIKSSFSSCHSTLKASLTYFLFLYLLVGL